MRSRARNAQCNGKAEDRRKSPRRTAGKASDASKTGRTRKKGGNRQATSREAGKNYAIGPQQQTQRKKLAITADQTMSHSTMSREALARQTGTSHYGA